ncbi:MAG: nucleoside-diphosphate kinase [Dehalococcoidia bacterium]|nr:nucleoside-diphosphate kinase [Dehalococcoidia bacterium]|tara:strand:- start:17281 stop:17733 length:453 start_codon:yes stop_codon:yes gene_type:complete
MERTLCLLKPDAVQRGLVGKIIGRLENKGLKIVGTKMILMDINLAKIHYSAHVDKPFFAGMANFMTSSPILALALEGNNAVEVLRNIMGATDPQNADLGTIRADFAMSIGRNLVHGSDSAESAEKELGIFFKENEIFNYERDQEKWVIEF